MTFDYLEKRQKNKIKKMLRLQKPYLMGPQLNQEVERIMGIADSGKMDWAMAKKTEVSEYPTPESITEEKIRSIAKEFGLRPYVLYWFFMQKVTKLKASGRDKFDYLEVLKEVASSSLKKSLSDEEKITAVLFFANFTGVNITREQVELLLLKGDL